MTNIYLEKIAALALKDTGETGGRGQRILMENIKKQRQAKSEIAFNVPQKAPASASGAQVNKINALPAKERLQAAAQAQRRSAVNPSNLPMVRPDPAPVLVGKARDVTPATAPRQTKALVPYQAPVAQATKSGILGRIKANPLKAIGAVGLVGAGAAAIGSLTSRKDNR